MDIWNLGGITTICCSAAENIRLNITPFMGCDRSAFDGGALSQRGLLPLCIFHEHVKWMRRPLTVHAAVIFLLLHAVHPSEMRHGGIAGLSDVRLGAESRRPAAAAR